MKQKKLIWILSVLAIGGLSFYFASEQKEKIKGNKQYGGVLRISTKNKQLSLFPLGDNTLDQQRIQQLVYEPLLKPSQNKRGWRYCLASKVQFNRNKTKVTIHLKKNVLFANNACFRFRSRELTAVDVAYSLSLACAQQPGLQQELFLPRLIIGGADYYRKKMNPLDAFVPGIHIIDKHTLKINLTAAYNHFLNILSSPSLCILSKNSADFYGAQLQKNPVGTGPFELQKTLNNRWIFERNPDYWRHDRFGNQLPYLDKVEVACGVPGQVAQRLFLRNKLDLVFDLPIDDLKEAFGTLSDAKLGKNPLHEVYVKNAAKVHFIQFNCQRPPFDQIAVRKAFKLVVDVDNICNDILLGEGRGLNGLFIPPQTYYQNKLLGEYPLSLNQKIKQAQMLLLKAGYHANNPFPTIVFYVGAPNNTIAYKWSKAAAEMLTKALNINIVLKESRKPSNGMNNNSGEIWRSGWVGDYPGAESYLRLFYSASQNPKMFHNASVDSLYLGSVRARSQVERISTQQKCEREIINQVALIPIYTEDFIVLNQLRIRGLDLQETGLLDFSMLFRKEIN
jgi:ABC-type oligopeptide transport system substrate-binding subunit